MQLEEYKMAEPQRVLVVGGEIAGLATARALQQKGLETDVVERAAAQVDANEGRLSSRVAATARDHLSAPLVRRARLARSWIGSGGCGRRVKDAPRRS